jgi:DNA-binding NarL/FixJ family response regulator
VFTRNIRVLIADEHPLVVESLGIVFDAIEGIELVGHATNGAEAIQLIPELQPDVVLMDLRMPVMDGFQATSIIHELFPRVIVIVLSGSSLEDDIETAKQAGAHAFLSKQDASGTSIVAHIRAMFR